MAPHPLCVSEQVSLRDTDGVSLHAAPLSIATEPDGAVVSTATSRLVSALPPKLAQPLIWPAASLTRARQWYDTPLDSAVTVTLPWTGAPVDATGLPARRPLPLKAVVTGLISTSGTSESVRLASVIVKRRTTVVWLVHAPTGRSVVPSTLNCPRPVGRPGATAGATICTVSLEALQLSVSLLSKMFPGASAQATMK